MTVPEPVRLPAFGAAKARPGLRDLWRSMRNPVLGWPASVFEGGVYRSRLPGAPLVIGDPDLAAEILVERSDEFPHGDLLNRLFAPIWGKGIFIAEGADWRWQRRAAAPAFRPAQTHMLAPLMRRAAEERLRTWRPDIPIDLQEETRRLTLRILFDSLLSGGADFGDLDDATRRIDAFIAGVGRIGPADVLPIPGRWRRSAASRGGAPAAYMRSRIDAMIARRRAEGVPRGDLVDLLMSAKDDESGREMDDSLLRDNLMGFIAAGHETTAYALAWASWLVASHPDVRDRLLAEIHDVTGGAPVEGGHLDRLVFARQIIQEAMRLYPAAVAISREAARDTEIGGHRLRRGALVLVAVYALHRLPGYWERPEAFDPGRFAPGAQAKPMAGLYLPFGAGPRSCMGAAFAATELVVALATLVRAFRLEPDSARPPRLAVRMGGAVAGGGLWAIPRSR